MLTNIPQNIRSEYLWVLRVGTRRLAGCKFTENASTMNKFSALRKTSFKNTLRGLLLNSLLWWKMFTGAFLFGLIATKLHCFGNTVKADFIF